jgi:hypothetical protein
MSDVVVYNKITSALETKGFTVTEAGVTAPVDLKIELRLLEYSTWRYEGHRHQQR